jgi:hypothetical protein
MTMARVPAIVCAVFLSVVLCSSETLAHSGGTNADGCHTDRRTGDYHCHSPKPYAPPRSTYCHVLNGEARCGYAASTCEDLRSRFGGSCERE